MYDEALDMVEYGLYGKYFVTSFMTGRSMIVFSVVSVSSSVTDLKIDDVDEYLAGA